MNRKDEALLKYLEFNLIGLVNTIKPHLKDGTDEQEIYGMADDVLKEMRDSLTLPSGLTEETQGKM